MNLDYIYHKMTCEGCGHAILVERWLFGVSHDYTLRATCVLCLSDAPTEAFKEEHPQESEDIFNWVKEIRHSDHGDVKCIYEDGHTGFCKSQED